MAVFVWDSEKFVEEQQKQFTDKFRAFEVQLELLQAVREAALQVVLDPKSKFNLTKLKDALDAYNGYFGELV